MSYILLYEREMQRYIEIVQNIVLDWIKIISWTMKNRFTCIQFYFVINNVSLHLDYFSWKLCLCYMQKTFPSSKTLFLHFPSNLFSFYFTAFTSAINVVSIYLRNKKRHTVNISWDSRVKVGMGGDGEGNDGGGGGYKYKFR